MKIKYKKDAKYLPALKKRAKMAVQEDVFSYVKSRKT